MATFYIDPEGGLDTADGLSFANRKKTMTSITAAALTAGDSIRIMASKDPTSIGNATWTDQSATITLAAAVTTDVDTCDVIWTGVTNSVASISTTIRKQGTGCAQLAVAAAFTTGVLGYHVTGALDLSSKQQISFWIRPSIAIAAGCLQIELCSDTAGATPVNTFNIPAIPVGARWTVLTLDFGSALGSSIQSVRLNALTDPGTVNILIDNIIACKAPSAADSLTLNSLIGKNTTNETFYGLMSISGTTVIIDTDVEAVSGTVRPYCGVTETVTTYKIDPIGVAMQNSSSAVYEILAKNGSTIPATYMHISGGWDRTNMSTQPGNTWWDGRNGMGIGLNFAAKAGMDVDKLHFVRFSTGCAINSSTNITFGTMHANNCGPSGRGIGGPAGVNIIIDKVFCHNNTATGFGLSAAVGCMVNYASGNGNRTAFGSFGISLTGSFITLQSANACSNEYAGLQLGTGVVIKGMVAKNNAAGIAMLDGGTVYGLTGTLSGNSLGSVTMTVNGATIYTKDLVSTDTAFLASATASSNCRILGQNVDATANNHRINMESGAIRSHSGANRHTLTGIAWEYTLSGSGRPTPITPLYMSLARVACVANKLVTVSVWAKRIVSTSTITGRMSIVGKQLQGVPNDIYVETTATAGTWEQLTLTFTPTEMGVLEIVMGAYGTTSLTNLMYVDDFNFTQAP